MGDAVDLGFGESFPQELELRAAGEAITDRDPQDRAAVLSYEVGAVGSPLEVGEVAILVQDPRQDGNLLVEGLVGQALAGRLHASLSAALEEADEQLGVFLLEVLEELVRELVVCLLYTSDAADE